MFATIRAMEKMAAPISAMTRHFAAIEKMTAPATAITAQLASIGQLAAPAPAIAAKLAAIGQLSAPASAMTAQFAAVETMKTPGMEIAARSAQISQTFQPVQRLAADSLRLQATVPTFRSPMADLVVDSYRLLEPGRLFPSPRLFEQLRLFQTPTFNPLSALDIAANRALEWAPLLDENSNTKPIPGLDALLAGKRNKLASARLTGAYIQLLLYARDRFGKSPGKIIVSSPQVTRGPDTRSSTFKSTAGLASV